MWKVKVTGARLCSVTASSPTVFTLSGADGEAAEALAEACADALVVWCVSGRALPPEPPHAAAASASSSAAAARAAGAMRRRRRCWLSGRVAP